MTSTTIMPTAKEIDVYLKRARSERSAAFVAFVKGTSRFLGQILHIAPSTHLSHGAR